MITEKWIRDRLKNILINETVKAIYERNYRLIDLAQNLKIDVPIIFLKSERQFEYEYFKLSSMVITNASALTEVWKNLDNYQLYLNNAWNEIINNVIACNNDAVNTIQWMLNVIQQQGWTPDTMNYITNTLTNMQTYFNSNTGVVQYMKDIWNTYTNTTQEIKTTYKNILTSAKNVYDTIGWKYNATQYVIATENNIKLIHIDPKNEKVKTYTIASVRGSNIEIKGNNNPIANQIANQIIQINGWEKISIFVKNTDNPLQKYMLSERKIWPTYCRIRLRRKTNGMLVLYLRDWWVEEVIKAILARAKKIKKRKILNSNDKKND